MAAFSSNEYLHLKELTHGAQDLNYWLLLVSSKLNDDEVKILLQRTYQPINVLVKIELRACIYSFRLFNLTRWCQVWHQGKSLSGTPQKTRWCHTWHHFQCSPLKKFFCAEIIKKRFSHHATFGRIRVDVLK